MLYRRSLIERLIILSSGCSLTCVLLNYVTDISPITGIWFTLYLSIIFVTSLIFSIKLIQWFLHLHKPLSYDAETCKGNPYLAFIARFVPNYKRREKSKVFKEYDTNELSVISSVLERKLVSSWYSSYVSEEIGFPFACKQLLDQMIARAFQICHKIEPKDVFVDTCYILSTHLKEYSKTLKRHEKSPTSPIETLYQTSHPISDPKKNLSSADHCTNIIRMVLKELVPWELWETPYSELIVRILAKKLDTTIDKTIADPAWLNDRLLTMLEGKNTNETEKPNTTEEASQVDKKEDDTIVKESTKVEPKVESTPVIVTEKPAEDVKPVVKMDKPTNGHVEEKMEDIVEEVDVRTSQPVEIQSSPVMRQRRGRQGRNEVKIYDRVIEGSVKTWESDIDLQCISLGQDLLASLDGEITLSRLWGQEADADGSPNPPKSKSPQPLWFGEEDMELPESPKEKSPGKKEQLSPKPADVLLKDIQTTVSQAKTKIVDLQVQDTLDINVPRKSGDEAAGMMEGLLDFGIAGFKKGLRFTGLSDDSQDKSPFHNSKEKFEISPPLVEEKTKPMLSESKELSPDTNKDDTSNGVHQLVKQHRVMSQDSVPSLPLSIPPREPPVPLPESPEPQYEEAADLSTSIAKLRSLLQQADASPRAEEIWWETAEETRGRTQTHHSSRPVDTATLADEYDMLSRSPPNQSGMQRFDRLLARTVGVFQTIRSAVEGENSTEGEEGAKEWSYVTTSVESSVYGAVSRLVSSRRRLGHIEPALDSLQQLQSTVAPPHCEEWAVRGGGACLAVVGAGVELPHVAVVGIMLLAAEPAEALIDHHLDVLSGWLHDQLFQMFEQMSAQPENFQQETKQPRPFCVDDTCAVIMEKLPSYLHIFSEETLRSAVKLTVTSFTHKTLNKDFVFRLLDLLALHFKQASMLRNPNFDAN